MASLSTTVETIIDIPGEAAFLGIVPIDLSKIFTGFGPLPAVSSVSKQNGEWDATGKTRTVHLSDGSTAQEKINEYKKPKYFSYTVSDFTGILRFLTTSANGEWWFEKISENKTSIRWRYAFTSRNFWAIPFLLLLAKALWRCYMKKALSLSKQQVEDNFSNQN